jgi:polyketide biosynthesis acyl carrier protein
MTRDEVLNTLKKQIKETLDEVDIDAIDCDRSMKDYDANSLDVIEIISGTMRELKIKVPREELEDLTTINQLIDVLLRHSPN